jgi:hypothetical protein
VQVERSEDEDATSETADTVESGTEDQSQELGTSPAKRSGQIGQIMEAVVDQQRRIRDTRKLKVLESYDNAYTTAQTSIGTLFDDHEKQSWVPTPPCLAPQSYHRWLLTTLPSLPPKHLRIHLLAILNLTAIPSLSSPYFLPLTPFSAAAHHAQLKALKALLAEKAKVEKAMIKMLADLRQSYDVHSRDLEAALIAKTEELK